MAIAVYIAKWFSSEASNGYERTPKTIREIEAIWGKPIPPLQSKTVKWLILKRIPDQTEFPIQFVANNKNFIDVTELGAYTPPYDHVVAVNLPLITKRKRSLASILVHELDHALVDMKSSGKAFSGKAYKEPAKDFKAYLQQPIEINARFAQALWDMASRYDSIVKADVHSTVSKVLAANNLTQDIVKDPKQYKKLITRSYKFLDDVGYIIADKEQDKPTLIQRVKTLIRKWLP